MGIFPFEIELDSPRRCNSVGASRGHMVDQPALDAARMRGMARLCGAVMVGSCRPKYDPEA